MTNRDDWMLEWVDRGPAAAGWRDADAYEAALNAEALAAINYESTRRFSSLNELFKYALRGADGSPENVMRTAREVADELKPDYHFGQSHYSPATRAFLILEACGRITFDQPLDERRGQQGVQGRISPDEWSAPSVD